MNAFFTPSSTSAHNNTGLKMFGITHLCMELAFGSLKELCWKSTGDGRQGVCPVVEIAGILSRLCKGSLGLHQHRGVVVAATVHRQGLLAEVVTILAQAWCCRIPAHLEGFAIPDKPLCQKQLAFGRSEGCRAWGPTWLLQTVYFWGISRKEQLWFSWRSRRCLWC